MVRVRIAPSPTGFLHIGTLRTALYDWLFARRHEGVFVLRIEDTDRTRYVEGAVENVLRTLSWAGIAPDEGPYLADDGTVKERGEHGPYVQSARLSLYRKYADELLQKDAAYRCFCSAERLEEVRKAQTAANRPMTYDRLCRKLAPEEAAKRAEAGESHVLRLAVPESGTTEFTDEIRGLVQFANADVDDQVLMKSDGYPTYHLAVVIDDHLMRITHVIRGEEWIPSTPKHVLLYQAFGWELPRFAHLPLLLNADRSKLSKRQGDVAVEDYRAKGFLPEALVNFVALMGWNPSGTQEVYTKKELAAVFDLSKVNKAGAVFDPKKLEWLNREYLRSLPLERVAAEAKQFYAQQGMADAAEAEPTFSRAVSLERGRVSTLAELPEATSFLFNDGYPLDAADLAAKGSDLATAVARLRGLRTVLEDEPGASFEDPKALEASLIAFIKDRGWTNGDTLWPLRVALTGRRASPSPFDVAWTLGKVKTLSRIERAIAIADDTTRT
jgi:nondiscriminating glutamyl-tRNA synthetase